jgi:LysR family glycine cleavage system transcriptional activator
MCEMKRRLPPPHALRTFESAATHRSFTKAADELHLTQSAVSQQIRQLEDDLSVRLFRRIGRGLVLTEEGEVLYQGAHKALDILRDTMETLDGAKRSQRLVVSVLPSFGTKWFVPRLHRFLKREMGLRVTVMPTVEVADFSRDDVDMAIRWGLGDWPALFCKRILSESEFPVCALSLLQSRGAIHSPKDLLDWPLLGDVPPHDSLWTDWFAYAGVDSIPPAPIAFYDDASHLIQAAADGQGVALVRSALAVDDLRTGRLVKLLDVERPCERGYYLVCPSRSVRDSRIKSFERWLEEEAAATQHELAKVQAIDFGKREKIARG